MKNQWQERDLINAGWLHPEEAEGLQLRVQRLRRELYAATVCPECKRELPPRHCVHCSGTLNGRD